MCIYEFSDGNMYRFLFPKTQQLKILYVHHLLLTETSAFHLSIEISPF